jgi:hypothetical protein
VGRLLVQLATIGTAKVARTAPAVIAISAQAAEEPIPNPPAPKHQRAEPGAASREVNARFAEQSFCRGLLWRHGEFLDSPSAESPTSVCIINISRWDPSPARMLQRWGRRRLDDHLVIFQRVGIDPRAGFRGLSASFFDILALSSPSFLTV